MLTASRIAVSAITLYESGQKVRPGKWPEMPSHVETLDCRAVEDELKILPHHPDMLPVRQRQDRHGQAGAG